MRSVHFPRPAPRPAPAPTPSRRRTDGEPIADAVDTPDLRVAMTLFREACSTLRLLALEAHDARAKALRALEAVEARLILRPDVVALLRREDALVCAERDRHDRPVRPTRRHREERHAVRQALALLLHADGVDRA